jgi:hypothetical protein
MSSTRICKGRIEMVLQVFNTMTNGKTLKDYKFITERFRKAKSFCITEVLKFILVQSEKTFTSKQQWKEEKLFPFLFKNLLLP